MSAEPTLAAVAQALQDAAQLAGRYGSTTAARERLVTLEREHEALDDVVALLRSRLRQGEAEARRLKSAVLSAAGLDAERFIAFLERRFVCRGDLTVLLDALVAFQTSPRDSELDATERVGRLTIERADESTHRSSLSPKASSASSYCAASDGPVVSTASSSNGNGATGGYSAMGIGIRVGHQFYQPQQHQHQSLEEEEQEIHLAAKQLLSPVTFARVEDDDDSTTTNRHANDTDNNHTHTHNPFVSAPLLSDAVVSPSASTAAVSSSFLRAQTPDAASLKKLLPKKPKAKKARLPTPSLLSPKTAGDTDSSSLPVSAKPPAAKKRKVVLDENLVIKQNLAWPVERRNITDMKLSSRFLSLPALESLDRQTPWNEMYKRRPLVSHVVDYTALDERAQAWFVTTLKIQFVWRRELWERLHWLPMSESVCTGAAWERYRQTRKRRAKHAVTAWRKVYAQSIQMIEAGLLPDDVWCDPALWYMPANPVYWLPDSDDIAAELAAIDAKHAVRCYHVYDLRRHPFYALGLAAKYPTKFDLPSFSSFAMPHSIGGGVGTSEEDLASFAMKDHHHLALADLAPLESSSTGVSPQYHHVVASRTRTDKAMDDEMELEAANDNAVRSFKPPPVRAFELTGAAHSGTPELLHATGAESVGVREASEQ